MVAERLTCALARPSPRRSFSPDAYHPLAAVSRVHRSGHKKSGPCHSAADFTGGPARGRSYISYTTRLFQKEKSSGISGAMARQPRPGVVGKAAGQQDQVPGPRPVMASRTRSPPRARDHPRADADGYGQELLAAGVPALPQPALPWARHPHGSAWRRPRTASTGADHRSIFSVRLSTRPVREGTRAAQPGIPASRPVLVAWPSTCARERRTARGPYIQAIRAFRVTASGRSQSPDALRPRHRRGRLRLRRS